ncbi:DEBR0S1_18470g1_1 [Brettanomyces bruxellensis]|uniref:Pre-rRNA-processing protein ESF2 n=1 Tax=Dekkera bruxellensis TaxID=5007 RepID=A0A7D9GZ11_DEKBR|nr:DEBR0S1_18470g1_1 [Brettanomyces bruxellensis]
MKKLTPEQLEKAQKRIKRSGVVYLSSMPPYMKPTKLRQIMERFGAVGRIFLKPEDTKSHKSRVKSGGNKKRKFDEGWCEFKSKKAAKLAAETLNGNIIGGKKRGFYHDDILNVKYLRGFKWGDLTRALNREKEVRESKMEAELARERRMNKAFIENVETSKKFNNIRRQRSKKRQREENEPSGAKGRKFSLNRKFVGHLSRDPLLQTGLVPGSRINWLRGRPISIRSLSLYWASFFEVSTYCIRGDFLVDFLVIF